MSPACLRGFSGDADVKRRVKPGTTAVNVW